MKILSYIILCLSCSLLLAQKKDNPSIFLITVDGLRWQDLFRGVDANLIKSKTFVENPKAIKRTFWRNDFKDRREVIFPFIWKEVTKMGQLHGNRNLGSKVNLTNAMWFSYPGYNEILTGRADDSHINSNDKVNNPNKTILELINRDRRYSGQVAAFGSWDVFPYIINEKRSRVPVNAGYERVLGTDLTPREKLLNDMQFQAPKLWNSVRLDAFTYQFAKEHLRKYHPKFLYIAYGETDDFAHEGHYDKYIQAAHRTDSMIKDLWEFAQSDKFYRDNTIFFITTDHGRGDKPLKNWQNHGENIEGADAVWLIIFGRGVKATGEGRMEQLYTTQIAPTIMKLFKTSFDSDTPSALNLH